MGEKKKALITGITGQDGSYLAEFLLDKNYEVFGLVRRVSFEDESRKLYRIRHILDKIELIPGSMESFPSIYKAIHNIQPDEVYHLAAVSYVGPSFDDEISTMNVNINGIHHVLAACKDLAPECKIFFPGSSEMFGQPESFPQNESTQFSPSSAYGISKLAGYHLTKNYRDKYNIYACSGILFNHESPRRGFEFVTRKITSTAAKIKLGIADNLKLGNLQAKRDWGHADEYVEVIWKMLQQEKAEDFVISTGKTHTVEQFCDIAFQHLGLNFLDFVEVDSRFYREEKGILVGDSAKAHKLLGWKAEKSFVSLVHEMVDSDLEKLKKD